MQKFLYILLFFLSVFQSVGQNLLLNGDFEDTLACPINIYGEIEKAMYWTSPCFSFHTSDYFNLCSFNYSIIFNGYHILPKSGSGFAGIILFPRHTSSINYREYLEGMLSQPLKKNKEYCIDLYIRPNKFNEALTNELQILFTDSIIKRDSCARLLVNVTPQVNINISHGKDTANWTFVTASFIASGIEKYITIGNFKNNLSSDTVMVNWGLTASYYYFDDIKIYYCGPDTFVKPKVDSIIIPNVFTPNGDGYNDNFNYKNQEQWEFVTQVFNRWGDLIFDNKSSENWDGTFEGKKVPAGVYFYIIKAVAIKTGELRIYKGTVTVIY